MEKVGLIGAGAMGSALLERLKLAGAPAIVYDVDPAALAAAGALGAETAASAAEVARAAGVVDVVVRSDDEVLQCTLGEEGVVANAAPGALLVLHSTILPGTTRRVAEAARARGVHVIDACMLGVPRAVRDGRLIFVVGGDTDLVERARTHLLRMGRQVIHMGGVGAGNTAKLIKNLTSGAETLMMHEALQLGESEGLKFPQVLEMLQEVESERLVDRWRTVFDPALEAPTPRLGHNVFQKDVPLAGALAAQKGLRLPIIKQLAAAAKRLAKKKR
ncbi:MAG TPA: NAD(P)-binding domain-containing protein [Candidatus Binatia bacterium]